MPLDVELTGRLVVGVVFLWSGVLKAADFMTFVEGIYTYDAVPRLLVFPVALFVVGSELAIGVSHLAGQFLSVLVPVTLALLASFAVATILVISKGASVKCLCFGSNDSELLSFQTLLRISLLAAVELTTLYFLLSEPASETAVSDRTIALHILLACLVLLAASWSFASIEVFRIAKDVIHRSTRRA